MSETHSYGQGVSGFDQTFGMRMREFVPSLVRLARLAPGEQVLDIATGTGNAAEEAAAAVGPLGHVTAADDTPAMIELARMRLRRLPNVNFAIEQATSLTFADASFDVVLCSMALMIFPDRERAFPFPSFDAYFKPFEDGGGPWGAAYANLSTDARRAVREDVQRILSGNTGTNGTVTIEADIMFGCGLK